MTKVEKLFRQQCAPKRPTMRAIAALLRECLERAASVEIAGLGVFRRAQNGEFLFAPYKRPKLFIAYVEEDLAQAQQLCQDLRAGGCDPWLDREALLPGQNWPRRIEQAIELSDYFVALFSRRSVVKRGQFQAELRYALDCAARLPLDQTFLIPVRLEECRIPAKLRQSIHYVDLFPDWRQGINRLLKAVRTRED